MSLLAVENLTQHYAGEPVPALRDINLSLNAGETTALVGRSGCGKSTLSRLLVGLETPTGGEVRYASQPVSQLDRKQLLAFRRDVQLVFQDACSAVNPRMRIGDIVAEPLRHLTSHKRPARESAVRQMLERVDLNPSIMALRPSQLSGGQLQRVCLARALIIEPQLVILDEAVSSLDVVVQAQILQLLRQLRQQTGTTFLFITHDLRLIEGFCQRVVVMDHGTVVEDQAVSGALRLISPAGRALQQAVLPALPPRPSLDIAS